MKVILLENVKKVGNKNEVVEVSTGFAQNVLFKKKQAVEANETNLAKLNARLANDEADYQASKEEALEIKAKMEAVEYEFKLKAGKNGAVFGSVSTKQIIAKLKEVGYSVDKKQIHLEPISRLGYETVKVKLHKEVEAEIKILIKGE
ncbi:MAG: 50S ribosomal protein L9 [Mycoplasmatales bacterium]